MKVRKAKVPVIPVITEKNIAEFMDSGFIFDTKYLGFLPDGRQKVIQESMGILEKEQYSKLLIYDKFWEVCSLVDLKYLDVGVSIGSVTFTSRVTNELLLRNDSFRFVDLEIESYANGNILQWVMKAREDEAKKGNEIYLIDLRENNLTFHFVGNRKIMIPIKG